MSRVRIGFIGCGGMARHHGRVFVGQVPDAQIVALCDTSKDSLKTFTADVFKNGGLPKCYRDHRLMLKRERLDGVVIVSPHTLHAPQILDCLRAGAHVLVEKPMVTNVADAHRVLEAQQKSGLTVSISFQGVHSPEFAYIRRLRDDGELGEINLIAALVTQNWKHGTRGTWRQVPKWSGGGQAYDSGAHMFSAILDLSGLRPVEIFAWCDNKDTPVDIITSASIKFENGCLATAAVSGESVTMEEGVSISGTRGYLRTAIYGGRLEHWDARGQRVKYPVVPPTATPQQNLVDCIRGRGTTPAPPLLGLRQALLMEALYRSAKLGKPVTIAKE